MKHLLKSITAIALLTVAVASCQKERITRTDDNSSAQSIFTKKSSGADCCTSGTTEYTTEWVDSTAAVRGTWPPLNFDFCSGSFVSSSSSYHFSLTNRFNSYVTGNTGWTLSYLDGTSYPVSNYNSISCISTGSLNPSTNNTMGMGQLNGGSLLTPPGWYNYNFATHGIDPIRLMVVSNGTKYYLLYIESITPDNVRTNPLPPFNKQMRATIKFHYKCIEVCS